MSNEKVSQLPAITNATLADIIYEIQGGISSQATLQQVFNLMLSNVVLTNAGNPNGAVAGNIYQLLWDSTNHELWVCTSSGSAVTAIWTLVAPSASSPVGPGTGGTGVSNPTAHTLPVAEGSSNFHFLGPLTNGQLLIGSTGADPVPATITAGTNITMVNNAGSIEISATGSGGITWTVVTGTSQTMSSNAGYIANNAGLVTLTLPSTSSVGDELFIVGKGAGGWSVVTGAGQTIVIGSSTASASVSSTNAKDSMYIVCTLANLEWTSVGGPQGNLTVV